MSKEKIERISVASVKINNKSVLSSGEYSIPNSMETRDEIRVTFSPDFTLVMGIKRKEDEKDDSMDIKKDLEKSETGKLLYLLVDHPISNGDKVRADNQTLFFRNGSYKDKNDEEFSIKEHVTFSLAINGENNMATLTLTIYSEEL